MSYKFIFKKPVFVYSGRVTICKIFCRIYKDGEYIDIGEVYGHAIAHNDDKYNKQLGERIAESRASKRAYSLIRKSLVKDYKRNKSEENDILNAFTKLNRCNNKETLHLKDLLKQTNK